MSGKIVTYMFEQTYCCETRRGLNTDETFKYSSQGFNIPSLKGKWRGGVPDDNTLF